MLYSLAVDRALLRIGELSKRSGVSPELLRAWERRYGLLRPDALVRRAAALLARRPRARASDARAPRRGPRGGARRPRSRRGAAPRRRGGGPSSTRGGRARARRRARRASTSRARRRSSTACSRSRPSTRSWPTSSCPTCTSSASAGSAARRRSRRSTSPRTCSAGGCSAWPAAGVAASGRCALLACLPGEQHELGLIAFGLALRSRGWRIAYLGGDTPLETLENAAERARAGRCIALSAVAEDRVESLDDGLRRLARDAHRSSSAASARAVRRCRMGRRRR